MNRLLLIALGAVLVLGGQAYGQNLLLNPGLEDGADPEVADFWTTIEPDLDPNGAPVNTMIFQPAAWASHSGTRGVWFRAFMQGLAGIPSANATLQQDVPGTPGEEYTLSAWWKYEANYSGLNPFEDTQTILALEFLDAGNAVIGGASLDIDTVQTGDNTWREFSVSDVAPAGTMMIRARASMINGVISPTNPQSAFVDDFTLVPEPAALLLLLAAGLLRRR